jgi:hypothetical protein
MPETLNLEGPFIPIDEPERKQSVLSAITNRHDGAAFHERAD